MIFLKLLHSRVHFKTNISTNLLRSQGLRTASIKLVLTKTVKRRSNYQQSFRFKILCNNHQLLNRNLIKVKDSILHRPNLIWKNLQLMQSGAHWYSKLTRFLHSKMPGIRELVTRIIFSLKSNFWVLICSWSLMTQMLWLIGLHHIDCSECMSSR